MAERQSFGGVRCMAPERRIFPSFDPNWEGRVFSRGDVDVPGVKIVIEDAVMESLLDLVSIERRREVGGVLVGGYWTYNTIEFVTIDAFVAARHTEAQSLEIKFTHETWSHIQQVMETTHPTRHIVGWYHTHPRSGVYLSGKDLFIHQSFFSLPWQVALVVDPSTRASAFFHWRDGEVKPCGHHYLTRRLIIE